MENGNYPRTHPAFRYFPPLSAWIDPNSVSPDGDKTPAWVIVGVAVVAVMLCGFLFYCIRRREKKIWKIVAKPAPSPAPAPAPAPAPKEEEKKDDGKQAPAPKIEEKKPPPPPVHPRPIFIPMGLPAHCPRCGYKGGRYSSSYACTRCAWQSNRSEG